MNFSNATPESSSKTLTKPQVKRMAIGGTGASAATMVLVYQLFATKAELTAVKWEAEKRASVMWQNIKTLENDLDSARMDIVRLQTLKTNTP